MALNFDFKNMKLSKVASIVIGIVLSVLILFVGFQLLQNVFTRAEDITPRDVVVSDMTQNAATITYTTNQETQGVIEYGTSPTALNFFSPEAQKTKTHSIELTLLSPNTTYYFQVRIGDQKFDNGGVPWSFVTRDLSKTSEIKPSPTITPVPSKQPTPIQRVVIPDSSDNLACGETECKKICEKLHNGCTTQDIIKAQCIGKIDIKTCSLTVTSAPTSTPSATPTQ